MKKEDRKKLAEEHYKYTQYNYLKETIYSATKTDILTDDNVKNVSEKKPTIKVVDSTTEDAVLYIGQYNCGVLNFASYKRPGGGYLNGSMAQEEALCHASNLYDILERFKYAYVKNYNRDDFKNGLYRNWAIYTPFVEFDKDGVTGSANVLTCPAPNYNKWKDNGDGDEQHYLDTLKTRLRFVLDSFVTRGDRRIILGAFGCGVFGNNPETVATMFKELLDSGKYNFFDEVFFAINGGENYNVFKKVFEG